LSGDRSDSDALEVTSTETYGIPTLLAAGILERYCRDSFTRSACSDRVLRDHLAFMLGDLIKERLPAPREKEYRYDVDIEMVNRVYLTRAIVRRRTTANERSGSAEPPAAGSAGTEGSAAVGASGKSQSENDFLLDRAFQRPVAFGYRAVKFNFRDADATPSLSAGKAKQ
jgi:hypothetical protein